MTTLIQDIQSVLEPAVAGGSFYAVNTLEMDEATVFPFVTFVKVSSSTNNTLAGPSDLQNTRVQVDIYATDPGSLESAAAAVIAAITTGPFRSVVQLTSADAYEDQVRVYRRSTDFSIWSTN